METSQIYLSIEVLINKYIIARLLITEKEVFMRGRQVFLLKKKKH